MEVVEMKKHFTFMEKDSSCLPSQAVIANELQPTKIACVSRKSIQTISSRQQKITNQESSKDTQYKLPLNFFHSPGQYNKLLIHCGISQKQSRIENQIGLIKNLEFLNKKIFDMELGKRQQRIKKYCENQARLKKKDTPTSNIACSCCCCDKYCLKCESDKNCTILSSDQQKRDQYQVDFQKFKNNINNRKLKSAQSFTVKKQSIDQSDFLSNKEAITEKSHNFRIEQLLANTLIKQIEDNRNKEIQRIKEKKRKMDLNQLNSLIRQRNRQQIQKGRNTFNQPRRTSKSKKQKGQQYWLQKKTFIYEQLKQKIDYNLDKEAKDQNKRKSRFTIQQIEILRKNHQKEVLKKIKRQRLQELKKQNKTKKSLQKLDKQRQIILQNCYSESFKPSKSMIQNAFQNLY